MLQKFDTFFLYYFVKKQKRIFVIFWSNFRPLLSKTDIDYFTYFLIRLKVALRMNSVTRWFEQKLPNQPGKSPILEPTAMKCPKMTHFWALFSDKMAKNRTSQPNLAPNWRFIAQSGHTTYESYFIFSFDILQSVPGIVAFIAIVSCSIVYLGAESWNEMKWNCKLNDYVFLVSWPFVIISFDAQYGNQAQPDKAIRYEILSQTNFCLISHLNSYLEVVKNRKICFKSLRKMSRDTLGNTPTPPVTFFDTISTPLPPRVSRIIWMTPYKRHDLWCTRYNHTLFHHC